MTPLDISITEIFPNLNTRDRITNNGSKWARMMIRVDKSSALIQSFTIQQPSFDITLFPGEGTKWTLNESIILVTKNINLESTGNVYPANKDHIANRSGGFTISNINGDILTLTPAAGATVGTIFTKGSMIFTPKLHAGQGLRIMLPGVINRVFLGAALNPLTSKTGACNTPNQGLVNTPHPIANVRILRNRRHDLVGLHEGGGTWNCGVFRPSARCKMQSEYSGRLSRVVHTKFCHVCKYLIVHGFNPSKHNLLDRLYPGNPT